MIIYRKNSWTEKKRNAWYWRTTYQLPEVQDAADFVRPIRLSWLKWRQRRMPKGNSAWGVFSMAETRRIVNPDKKVWYPDIPRIPMADMIDAQKVRNLKKKYPDAAVGLLYNTPRRLKPKAISAATVGQMPRRSSIRSRI